MKKLLVVGALTFAAVGVLAQGTLNFNNYVKKADYTIAAIVTDTDGTTKLAGTAFLAQLYAGKAADSLAAVGSPLAFRTGAGAGYVTGGGSVEVPTVALGGMAFAQMRVWDATGGASYEAALGKKATGVSNIINVKTGGDGAPPALPGDLVGLQAFSLKPVGPIPEPSTIALGLLGAAALLLRRRS